MSVWQPCILIPVYNHEAAIGQVIERLRPSGLPVILINDGSSEACRAVLLQLERDNSHVELLDLPVNGGKGAALKAGMRLARERGYSHALQIDADGQHEIDDLPKFLALGQQHPQALISGRPIYDEDIPAARFYGRYITQFWVMVNTLSAEIQDSMCGYRLYPVAASAELMASEHVGNRMDFDTEIMVRWVWRGGRVLHIPTQVRYPSDGVSHFRMWADNLLISRMHSRLFFGMLWRFPRLLLQSLAKPRLSA